MKSKTVQYVKNFTDEQYEVYIDFIERMEEVTDLFEGFKIHDKLDEWLTENNISKDMEKQMDKKYKIVRELEIMRCKPLKGDNIVNLSPEYIELRKKEKEQDERDLKFIESIKDAINSGKLKIWDKE